MKTKKESKCKGLINKRTYKQSSNKSRLKSNYKWRINSNNKNNSNKTNKKMRMMKKKTNKEEKMLT